MSEEPFDAKPRGAWFERPAGALVVFALSSVLLVYANFNSPFAGIDDDEHLYLATETPIASMFSVKQQDTPLPVSSLSLRLERHLFGPPFSEKIFSKTGYNAHPINGKSFYTAGTWSTDTRLDNALLQALSGFILWCFLRRIGAGSGVSILVAGVWTAHPMACESVCWISERKNVLAALFGFASLWACGSKSCWWRWPMVAIFYVLAVLSKPTAIGFLPVLIALEFFRPDFVYVPVAEARPTLSIGARLLDAWGLLLLGVLTIGVIEVNVKIHSLYFVERIGGSLFTALLSDLEIFSHYIFNIIAPVNLSFFYGVIPILSLADPRVWIYGAVLAAVTIVPIWATKGAARSRVIFGLIWFFGALGPTSNIAPIAYWMQDRYAFFSAPGLLLVFVECIKALLERGALMKYAKTLAIAFACMIGVLTAIRSPLFADTERLEADAAERQPFSGMAQVCAWQNYKNRAQTPADPARPESVKEKADNAYKAVLCFERATHCADLTNVKEAFEMRARTADMALHEIGDAQLANDMLNGWLPPPHLKQRDPATPHVAADMKYYYEPETLIFAQLIGIEAHLMLANPQRVRLNEFPLEARLAACKSVLAESERASLPKMQGAILKAKILLVLSDLEELAKDQANCVKHFEDAQALLKSVPKSSKLYPEAAYILSRVRAPEKK